MSGSVAVEARRKLKRFLWRVGYDVSAFNPMTHPIARRRRLLEAARIDAVLDIGANTGQYAKHLRTDLKFAKRILSFEPLKAAFGELARSAHGDPAWEVYNHAVGDRDGVLEINVAGNSVSSSFLGMLPTHSGFVPSSAYVGTETVEVKTVDSLFGSLCASARNVYMKIDTQGFETQVLDGARRSLERIEYVQLEASLIPLYAGESLFPEMCALMTARGYKLIAVEPGFCDPASGQLLQVDAIFQRARS